jgi:[ribosomal protein S5]-alanine N-acetyltransferase
MGVCVILHEPEPPLTDDVVRLRPWEAGDLDCVCEGTGLGSAESLEWIDRQRRKPANGLGVALAIVPAGQPAAAGYAGLLFRPRLETGPRIAQDGRLAFARQPGRLGIGYWVVERARGRGLATHAVGLLARWALTEAGMARVEALIEPANVASRRVAEACGFQYEGLLRAYLELDTGPADAVVYSLVAGDLKPDT